MLKTVYGENRRKVYFFLGKILLCFNYLLDIVWYIIKNFLTKGTVIDSSKKKKKFTWILLNWIDFCSWIWIYHVEKFKNSIEIVKY